MTKKILILKAVVIPEADTVIVVSLLLNTSISSSFHLCFITGAFHNFLAYSLLLFLQIMTTKQEAEIGADMLETMKTTMTKDQVRIW